jgi:hypothetical protein
MQLLATNAQEFRWFDAILRKVTMKFVRRGVPGLPGVADKYSTPAASKDQSCAETGWSGANDNNIESGRHGSVHVSSFEF